MKCSIIIVNHNTLALTKQTIDSIIHGTFLDYEIIVVDNSSIEEERVATHVDPHVSILTCENHGFGHACNRGFSVSMGHYVLFLNSDTIVKKETIEACVNYFDENNQIGALGCKIVLKDGSLDQGCRRGFPTPLNSIFYFLGFEKLFPKSAYFGGYHLKHLSLDEIHEIDAISGAFLMMKRSTFSELNGFDETFFMYGEDLDLCFRIKEKGLSVIYYPYVEITHLKGQSGLHTSSKEVIFHFYNAMLIFYRKHYQKRYGSFIGFVVELAIKIKYRMALKRTHHG